MLFDVEKHVWSRELFDAAGFSPEEFARPLPSGTVTGTVSPRIAAALGLEPGTLLVSGGHDQALAALGCGVCSSGSAMYAAGSVECIAPVHSRLIRSAGLFRGNLCSYDFSLPGRYLSVAYSLTGSNFMQYFLEEFCRDLNGDYAALAGSMPPEPTSIDVLPYFTASGTPFFDTRTPGTVHGWRLSTTRGELFAVLVLGMLLFASAVALVEVQYRTRLLFVEHEHEVDVTRRLMDDEAELLMQVRRASLPGSISAQAEALGMRGATGDDTITLVERGAGRIEYSSDTQRRMAAAEAEEAQRAQKEKARPERGGRR